MPSLFRRKSTDLVDEAVTDVTAAEEAAAPARPKGYTPSKKELGVQTPKRPSVGRRPVVDTSSLSKEEVRARRRAARAEAAAEFRREGGPRDRGPERRLVRDIVDSRRTVGTWFFGGALVVLIGSSPSMPATVRLASNLLWAALAVGVVIDSVLIARKVKKLVLKRFPRTDQRMGSLYLYAIMRGITFRRMRTPNTQVKIGDKV